MSSSDPRDRIVYPIHILIDSYSLHLFVVWLSPENFVMNGDGTQDQNSDLMIAGLL